MALGCRTVRVALVQDRLQALTKRLPLSRLPVAILRINEHTNGIQTLAKAQVSFRGNQGVFIRPVLVGERDASAAFHRFGLLPLARMNRPKLASGPAQKSQKHDAEVEFHQAPPGILEITQLQDCRQQAYKSYGAVEKMFVRNSHAAPFTSS